MKLHKINIVVSLFLIAILFGAFIFIPQKSPAQAIECKAKICRLEGKNCICCLQVEGSVACVGCGTTDCSGPVIE